VVATKFGISEALAAEIMYMNDEWGGRHSTPAKRWQVVRNWAEGQLVKPEASRDPAKR
jgi:hypothetical protein